MNYNQPQNKSLKLLSVLEFAAWKTETEMKHFCHYVAKSGDGLRIENVRERRFYCYRNGFFHDKLPRKKLLESQDSDKINVSCPSQMIYEKFSPGEVRMLYIGSLYGHDMENIGQLQLSKDEWAVIAGIYII